MPKYYTPKAAIRFANQDAVAFKKLAMTVEPVLHCVSDHGLKDVYYSGVIRYRRDDWKRYTVVWLYGDSAGRDVQDFVQPSISDIYFPTYYENSRVTSPSSPDWGTLTGSNFVDNMDINLADRDVVSTAYSTRNYVNILPPVWGKEQQNVTIEVIRPDFRTGTNSNLLSFEYRPQVLSQSQTGSFINGLVPIALGGAYFKEGSNASLSSGTGTWWSNNFTHDRDTLAGFFTPAVPATGVYTFNVRSPSGLTSQEVRHLTVSYRRPEISALLPYAFGTIAGSTPVAVVGGFFLSGATVLFDGLPVLSQSAATPGRIDVLTAPHAKGAIGVTVTNPQDGQVSLPFTYTYVIPLPTITDVNFSGTSLATRRTGSAGSTLYITGTNFTGSDAVMTVQKVTVSSGAFASASTAFVINGPNEVQFTIGTLIPSSHYDIEVSNSVGTASFTGAFEYQDFPVILSVSPTSGTVAGGLPVTVNGRPFYPGGASVVKFSGVAGGAQTYFNPTQVLASSPQAANLDGGFVEVSVQNYGSLEGGLPNAFEYVPFPTASSVSSPAGTNRVAAETGGTLFLNGTRLLAQNGSAVGTIIRTDFETSINTSFINTTRVAFNVLPHAAGFCGLTATNRNIATGAPLTAAFEYVNTPHITSLNPAAVIYTGGTTVNVVGSNFINSTDTAVYVAGNRIAATVTSQNNLSFVAPALAVSSAPGYAVTVVNKDTTVSPEGYNLQYLPQPFITSLSVTQGSNAGGTTVVVNGGGFAPSMSASFTGRSIANSGRLTVTYISPTQFSFVTPTTAYLDRGYAGLQVSVQGLTTAASNAFFYEQPVALGSLNPNQALAAGTTSVSIAGSGFINGVTTVDVDNVVIGATVNTSQQITFTAPAHALGAATVKVANTFLNASTPNNLTYANLPAPQITSFVVGSVIAGIGVGDAKWSTAGGSAHMQGVNWSDRIWGTNFTPSDVITVTPFYSGAPTNPTVVFYSSTELRFIMPANLAGGLGSIKVTNANGTSNSPIFVWNKAPVFSSYYPTFGHYANNTVIQMNGSGFSADTYITDGIHQITPVILNANSLVFTLPSAYNISTDWTPKNFWVANPTSQMGEAQTSAPGFSTVNPPNMITMSPITALTNGTTTVTRTPSDSTWLGTRLRLIQYESAGSYFYDVGLTNNVAGSDQRLASAHAAGNVSNYFGYINEAGAFFYGSGGTLTYYTAAPLSIIMTNQTSVADYPKVPGYVGTTTVITSPYVYAAPSGGVAPYTLSLEFLSNSAGPAEVQLPIQYVYMPPGPGQTWSARGYGPVYYDGADIWRDDAYRWKVVDGAGNIAYSTPVHIAYAIYDNTTYDPSCVIPNTLILMKGNVTIKAGDINVGDTVLTYPEYSDGTTLVEAKVSVASREQNRTVRVMFTDGRLLRCSFNHRVATKDGWTEAEMLVAGQIVKGTTPGTVAEVLPDGIQEVIKLTVPGARTYISNGLLSHNLKIGPGGPKLVP